MSEFVTPEIQSAELSSDGSVSGVLFYETMTPKAKEVFPQIEKILNGLSYADAESVAFAIVQKAKTSSLVAL